jgi:hypothetical protein
VLRHVEIPLVPGLIVCEDLVLYRGEDIRRSKGADSCPTREGDRDQLRLFLLNVIFHRGVLQYGVVLINHRRMQQSGSRCCRENFAMPIRLFDIWRFTKLSLVV